MRVYFSQKRYPSLSPKGVRNTRKCIVVKVACVQHYFSLKNNQTMKNTILQCLQSKIIWRFTAIINGLLKLLKTTPHITPNSKNFHSVTCNSGLIRKKEMLALRQSHNGHGSAKFARVPQPSQSHWTRKHCDRPQALLFIRMQATPSTSQI